MSGPLNFVEWVTTYERAKELKLVETRDEFDKIVGDERRCKACNEHVWRYAETGLCFLCTTGESNASGDYEIGEEYP